MSDWPTIADYSAIQRENERLEVDNALLRADVARWLAFYAAVQVMGNDEAWNELVSDYGGVVWDAANALDESGALDRAKKAQRHD
jgi:hypothetical protein